MPESASVPVSTVSLRHLRMRPGLSIRLGLARPQGALHLEVQFLAAIAGKGVMVGPYSHEGSAHTGSMGLSHGEDVVVQGFTGQHDFSFPARVLQTFVEPFVYALLTYPDVVQARQVRRAMRIRTALPAQVQAAGGAVPTDATVIDLSVAGALVRSPAALGAVDTRVTLSLADRSVPLLLNARICHTQPAQEGGGHHSGLQFLDVQQNDWLALHYLSTPAA